MTTSMDKIVECVPNFSEGRDEAVIQAIAAAIESTPGVKLLDIDAGRDFNRTVYTFVGEPESVFKAACNAARIGIQLIDMRKHKGEHPRMGALDVMPFIPIKGVSDEDCIELSKRFGEWLAKEMGIPVFLYAKSATRPNRVKLPDIRKGEYEALEEKFKDPAFKPDYGEPVFVPKSGATATGCRDILLAYNVNLSTNDKSIASDIAGEIRTSGKVKKDKDGNKIIGPDGKPVRIPGRFKYVQAGGMMYNENIAQVSMNLLNYKEVNMHDVYEAIKEEAEKRGVSVTGSEIVGLVPKDALVRSGRFYAEKKGLKNLTEDELVELAIEELGLSDLYPFNPEEKIIEYRVEEKGELVSKPLYKFIGEVASSKPAPGGGSVAATSGALGAALVSMVCNLTIGKKKYRDVKEEMKKTLRESEKLRRRLEKLVDEDTIVFNEVMKAYSLPKETEEEKEERLRAIEESLKKAAATPLETAETCLEVLKLAGIVAEKGNKNSITDAGVAALLAYTGLKAAILNVEINLGSIKDKEFIRETSEEIEKLKDKAEEELRETLSKVEQVIHNG